MYSIIRAQNLLLFPIPRGCTHTQWQNGEKFFKIGFFYSLMGNKDFSKMAQKCLTSTACGYNRANRRDGNPNPTAKPPTGVGRKSEGAFMSSITTTNKPNSQTPANEVSKAKRVNPLYDEVINDSNLERLSQRIAVSCLLGNYARLGNEVTRLIYADCIVSICVANRAKPESIKDTLNGYDCVQEAALAITTYGGKRVEEIDKRTGKTFRRNVWFGKKLTDRVKDENGNEVTIARLAYKACNTFVRKQAYGLTEGARYAKLEEFGDSSSAIAYTLDEFTRQIDDGDEFANFLTEVCDVMELGDQQRAALYLRYRDTEISGAEVARQLGKTAAAISKLIAKVKTRLLNNFGVAERTVAFNTEGIEECHTVVCGAIVTRPDGRFEWNGKAFI